MNKEFDYMVLDAYMRLQRIGWDIKLESLFKALQSHVLSNTKLSNKYTK